MVQKVIKKYKGHNNSPKYNNMHETSNNNHNYNKVYASANSNKEDAHQESVREPMVM